MGRTPTDAHAPGNIDISRPLLMQIAALFPGFIAGSCVKTALAAACPSLLLTQARWRAVCHALKRYDWYPGAMYGGWVPPGPSGHRGLHGFLHAAAIRPIRVYVWDAIERSFQENYL